jgi:uncharacterized protein (DUF952 family)
MAHLVLYKLVTNEQWASSQGKETLQLTQSDRDFIHFSLEDQWEKTAAKYYADQPSCVLLKIDAQKLPGRLVYETNPGGSTKYYHLYESCIPMNAILSSQTISH